MKDVLFSSGGENPVFGVLTVDTGRQVIIEVDGKRFRLYWSEMWGPSACDRYGDPLDKQPHHTHKFWRAATLWNRQGRRVESGVAVWHEPKPEILEVTGKGKRRTVTRVIQEAEDPDMSETILVQAPTHNPTQEP